MGTGAYIGWCNIQQSHSSDSAIHIINALTLYPIEKIPHLFVGAYLMGRGWDQDTARKFHQFIKIIGDYTLTTLACTPGEQPPGNQQHLAGQAGMVPDGQTILKDFID
jgi:hypothetical protein